jgi:hypothetical protein
MKRRIAGWLAIADRLLQRNEQTVVRPPEQRLGHTVGARRGVLVDESLVVRGWIDVLRTGDENNRGQRRTQQGR